MLHIKELHAGYEWLEVLKGVSIRVEKSEIAALIGPNGAGKSTVLKSIAGLADVMRGSIVFEGKNLQRIQTHELVQQGITYLGQGRMVFEALTIAENLELAAAVLASEQRAERMQRAYQHFPALKERKRELAASLSGGQRQMLALARVVVQQPKLLLLDEPSLGLSPKLQHELFAMLVRMRKESNMTMLLVEQNAKKAIEIADRTYLLEDGCIVLKGTGSEMLKHTKIRKVYLGGRY